MYESRRGNTAAALVAVAFALLARPVSAETTQTFSSWVQDIKWSGDIRIRQENFDKKTGNEVDRSRQRFRLRLNTDVKLPYKFGAKFTLASGTGEQTSTNQSFDSLGTQKQIWIDKAYVTWTPGPFTFQTGRMVNPIWRIYTSDIVWDDDFNPEGFSEGVSALVGPINLFANALQMVVDEDSGNNNNSGDVSQNDQWMYAWQLGTEFRLPLKSRAKVALARYDWQNETAGDFGQVGTSPSPLPGGVRQEGNRRIGTALANQFNVNEITGQLSSWIGSIPIVFQGSYIENSSVSSSTHPKANIGFQFGAVFGQAKDKNTFELAYYYKHAETDSTVADVADSDFGDGGTNRRGHIAWLGYAPADFLLLRFKYFQTSVIDEKINNDNRSPSSGADDIRRYQFDFNVKF